MMYNVKTIMKNTTKTADNIAESNVKVTESSTTSLADMSTVGVDNIQLLEP